MIDLSTVLAECQQELAAIGIPCGVVKNYRINYRAKTRFGACVSASGGFIIEISYRLLEDGVPLKSLKDTIIHELLHTCKGCQNHGSLWRTYADIVNRHYGYNIKRTSTSEEAGIPRLERDLPVKHRFVCASCGQVIERARNSKFVKNYLHYRCGYCKGAFKKVL